MSENLYFPMGLLAAGLIGWITAGVVFVLVPDSSMAVDLLGAGTGAMALGGASYQTQVRATNTTTKRKPTPRKPKVKEDEIV